MIRHRRTSAAVLAVAALIGSAFVLLRQPVAVANHGGLVLEVYREVELAPMNTGLPAAANRGQASFTARLMNSNGTPLPPGTGGGIRIHWEVENGPSDALVPMTARSNDGNFPSAPDAACTTVAPGPGPGFAACSVTFTNPTGLAQGTSTIRAWIDHNFDEGITGGSTESDQEEARLSSSLTDCQTEGDPSTGVTDQSYFEACEEGAGNAAQEKAGSTPERDITDVVELTWNDPTLGVTLDCNELTLATRTKNAAVPCRVLDTAGIPRQGVILDGETQSGANDPDDAAAAQRDWDNGCTTGPDGRCNFTVGGTEGQSDFATVCIWNDSGNDSIPPGQNTYDEAGTEEDGGECDVEAAPDGDTGGNETDRVRVKWENPVASIVDAEPDQSSGDPGTTHTITATVFDQFGNKWETNQTVGFEFFNGSPADGDGGTPATPDRTCDTNTGGDDTDKSSCSISYSAASAGNDLVCVWIGNTPTLSGSSPNGSCANETRAATNIAEVDVVLRTWNSPPGPGQSSESQGYTLVGADGGIYNYGSSVFKGSTGNMTLNAPIIGMANLPGGGGYWLVARDGGVFTFGDAKFHGSTGNMRLNSPVLGMEPTPSGKGYWLYAADGGIFTFGDAQFYGSTGSMKLNAPMIGMAVTTNGDGYWLVAQDGGVFTFGKAPFHGSTGSMKLNQPVFDMTAAANDQGYWLVARDGGVFTFGSGTPFYGSAAGKTSATVIGIGSTPTRTGYWIADSNGLVMAFGDARWLGDRSSGAKNASIVGFASVPLPR